MNNKNQNRIILVLTMLVLLTIAAPVNAAPSVPAEVSNIIADNCANCHVDRPSSHTDTTPGAQNSDQCSQCHVPYGNTDAYKHTATTTGCTNCHTTVEKTHFFMRDNDDQTKLVANAEDEGATSHGQSHGCIYCHRDNRGNGFTTTELSKSKAVPSLQTDADIIAAAEHGTLRSWIQPGGFMAKYLSSTEVAAITNWMDSTYTNDRKLGYDPYLDAVRTTDFDINDLVKGTDNAAWNQAPEHVVSVTPTVYTATDNIKLKAMYSDKYLYIRAEWKDSTASLTRAGSWILNSKWRHPKATTDNDKQSEDRLAVFWNMNTQNYKGRYGCALTCHGNVPGSAKFTDTTPPPENTIDLWHVKAARGLGVFGASDITPIINTDGEAFEATAGTVKFSGVTDDKRMIGYMDTDHGYDTEDSGRHGDTGKSAYGHNRNKDKSAPKFIETAPTSWADAMVLTQTEIDNGETIVADPTDAAYDAAAVADTWNKYVALKAVVPERILRKADGSRADVITTAVWKDGVWVMEFRRALVTGNADDVQFDLAKETEYDYSVAVFDNCGRGEIPPGHTTYGDGQYQVLRFVSEAQPTSVQTSTPSTPSTASTASTPSTPGFEAIFAVTGLLAAVYLLRRRE